MLEAACTRIERQLAALPPPLCEQATAPLGSMAARNRAPGMAGYFDHPDSYPTPQVIAWLGERYLPGDRGFSERVLEAALWLFLYVRLQDDVLDDPAASRERFGGTLHLMGGEPLLHPELLEIIGDGFAMGFTDVLINTNGTRMDAAMASRLAAFGAVDVLVSLDGPEALNDEIRGPGVYRRAMESIQLLADAGVATSVMVTVTRRLLPMLPGWIGELRSLGALKVVHLMPVGQLAAESRPEAAPYTDLLTAQELLRLYLVSWVNRPFTRITEDPLVNLFYYKMGLHPRKSDQCEACQTRIGVQADGRVSPCHPSDFSFGQFGELDLAELPGVETYRRMSDNDFDLCRTCRYNDICGMCGARAYAATGDPLGAVPVCVELKRLLGLEG